MYQIDPEAKAQAAMLYPAKQQTPKQPAAPSKQDTLQEKLILGQQKAQYDLAKERMRQEYARQMKIEDFRRGLDVKAADHNANFEREKLKLGNQMQPQAAYRKQPNQIAQQAVDNQYYQDAVQQVPSYLGNFVG